MKTLLLSALLLAALIIPTSIAHAQTLPTSAQVIDGILGVTENREELARLNAGITTLLADQRLSDQAVRQTLTESQSVFTEMLNQRVGMNAGKLVNFAKWLQAQAEAKRTIKDTGGIPTPQQQFVLDNPLAGQEPYLTSLLQWVLTEYVQRDREGAGPVKLEAYLQLYLSFKAQVERSYGMPDDLLFYAPQWIQSRYPQLTAEQKRLFLQDVNDARIAKTLPASDSVPAPPPTAQEQAAYNAAYQFILNNTPRS